MTVVVAVVDLFFVERADDFKLHRLNMQIKWVCDALMYPLTDSTRYIFELGRFPLQTQRG